MSTTSSTTSTTPSHDAPTRLNEGTVAKEVRAHEHARHRTKARQEHALTKGRKEKAAAVRVLGLKAGHGTKPVRKLSMEGWDGEGPAAAVMTTVTTPTTPTVEGAVPDVPARAEPAEPDAPRTSMSSFTLLTLGDLISRPRKPKAKQLDFEVVPPIRSVIALDDGDDEPWEYVTRASLAEGSSPWKGKSYAQVVVSAM